MQNEIRQFVIDNFLFGQSDRQLGNSDSFLESGIIDSTGVLELVCFLEEQYGVSIADDDVVPENLDTVDNIVRFVARKLPAAAA